MQFNQLFTMTNMPIKRFADQLHRQGRLAEYMQLLVDSFNPATLDSLMCRSLVSVSHDGLLYDCDFNQALAMPLRAPGGSASAGRAVKAAAYPRRAAAGGTPRTPTACGGSAAGVGSG